MHIPDHDPRALELAYSLIADFAPHVVIVGSDMLDFPNISRHPTSPKEMQDDALAAPLASYRSIMASLRDAAPYATMPYLIGNHDERLFDWIEAQAPQMRDYVLSHFIEDIKGAGALWQGRDYREFRLAHLNIIHGYKANLHTAAAYVNDYAEDVIAGHTHRPDSYFRQFRHRSAQAHVSGCLCAVQPHYSKYWQKWQHGLLLVTLTPATALTQVDNIVFNQYAAVWRGKRHSAHRNEARGRRQAALYAAGAVDQSKIKPVYI
jgi:hypothetical protein